MGLPGDFLRRASCKGGGEGNGGPRPSLFGDVQARLPREKTSSPWMPGSGREQTNAAAQGFLARMTKKVNFLL